MAACTSLPSLKHLPVTTEKLNALIRMDDPALRALCVQSLKGELSVEASELDHLRAVNLELMTLCDGLRLLVRMLNDRAGAPMSSDGLHGLLAPLVGRLQSATLDMNSRVF